MMRKILLVLCAAAFLLAVQSARAATYSFMNIPFAWDAPSGAATTVTWSSACTSYPGGDDVYSLVSFPSGFTFTFAGTAYSQVRVLSNGMIQFGAADQGFHRDYTSVALPAPASNTTFGGCPNLAPTNLLLMYWLDINTFPNIALAPVQYELLGTSPNRRFVITYNNVALYGNAATRYTFQAVLHESATGVNGNFEYRYTSGSSTGSGATVGVQVGATDYTQYAFNQTFIDTTNGTNILWYPQTTPASAGGVYHFNEASWNGTAGQVIDSSGIVPAQDATSVGLANTAGTTSTPSVTPPCSSGRVGIFPANTSNTVINAVATPLSLGNTGSIDFWYSSNVRWRPGGSAAMLFDATAVANRPFYLMKRADGALQFTVSDSAGTISTTTSATQSFAANTWQHVGVSWVFLTGTNQTFIQIFLNGALLTSQRYTTTGTIAALSTLNIGDNRTSGVTPSGGSPNSANGYIDEVKVYTSQINAYQANADMSCTALVDHLLIQSASTGLTCVSNPLTIVACQNAACTVNYTAGVTGTLSGVGTNMTVNWDGSTGGATGAGFATGGSGTAVKYVQVVTQGAATSGSVTFSISSPNPVPTNATVCNFGNNAPANNNCVYTVSTAGFIFSDSTTGGSYTIPPQVSGIATPTAPAANAIYLRALEASTSNPAVCTPALISSTTGVTMGYACNNPATCTTGDYGAINGTTIAAAGTAVSLTFDANGSAPIAVRYNDVGQITLNASVTPFAGATAMIGNSNAFVVAPHHFGFSGVPAGPFRAGNDFAPTASPYTTITAYNGLATPTATPNFGQETTPESVALSFAKCQPTGASSSAGSFSGSVDVFSGGTANATSLNWSEVGNGDLVATLASGNYLSSGLTVSGNTGTSGTTCNSSGAGNVGRFIPDHFDTIVTGPMTCPSGLTCPAGGLVYSGQSFTANVYARNAGGAITQNYDGTANTTPNFAKAVTLYAWDGPGSTTTQNPPSADPGSITGTSGVIAAGSFSQGATLSPGVPGTPIYAFGTTPTNPTDVYIRATDTDSVTSLRATNPTTTSVEGGVKVVSGRIKLANAYGSELLPLSIAATAQYYNPASNWVTSSTDNATQFNTNLSGAGGNVSATIVDASHGLGLGNISVVSPGVVTFASGIRRFSLAAPGKAGSADLSIVTAPDYLLPSITGRATFGVYKGKNEFIYMREAY
ncbi:MAG: DUF6701 domain-containing protein [Sideroxyarcus sp.]